MASFSFEIIPIARKHLYMETQALGLLQVDPAEEHVGVAIAAEKISRQLGETTPVEFKVGNLLTDDLGDGWDAALMISVLHVFNQEQARLLFKKVAAALAPGGVFVVLDHMRGVSRGRDSVVAMMGLNWVTLGGRSYSLDEVTALMTEAGFSKVSIRKLPARVGATVVLGSR